MKSIMKSVVCIVLIVCFTVLIVRALPATKSVDEFETMRAEVLRSTPLETEIEYEIETEDGNLWIIYGDSELPPGTKLVVVFYTFEDSDVECWDVLDYWATQK